MQGGGVSGCGGGGDGAVVVVSPRGGGASTTGTSFPVPSSPGTSGAQTSVASVSQFEVQIFFIALLEDDQFGLILVVYNSSYSTAF